MASRFDMAKDLNIIDVIQSEGIQLNKNNKCRCPFHNDSTASFSVYVPTNRFTCFGCGESGSTIDFIKKLHDISKESAVNYLLSKNFKSVQINKNVRNEENARKKQNYTYIWENSRELNNPSAKKGLEYFSFRGLKDIISKLDKKQIQIKYNSYNGYESIIYKFPNENFMIQKGIYKNEDGKRFKKNLGEPKPIIYTYYQHNNYMIVEGIEDGLSALALNYNFICLNSVNNTNAFISIVENSIDKFKTKKLVLCFDNDNTGDKTQVQLGNKLKKMGLSVFNSRYKEKMIEYGVKDLNDLYIKLTDKRKAG